MRTYEPEGTRLGLHGVNVSPFALRMLVKYKVPFPSDGVRGAHNTGTELTSMPL